MENLPDFIIGGTQKSGTTFLYNLIKNHHQIQMPQRAMKYSYFDDDRVYKKGIKWYKGLFYNLEKSKEIKIGQVSADCSFNEGSIERINKNIPAVKLIFVLRHPVERAYSQYWFMYANSAENKGIEEALKVENERVLKSYKNYKTFSYVGRSKYQSQFKNVYKHFKEEQVLIIPFDNLINSTQDTINKMCDFIGVQNISTLDELNISSIPKNKAKLPSNDLVVQFSFYVSKIGLQSLGKRVLNKFRKEEKPPPIPEEIRRYLECELINDILFYEKILIDFNNR